MLKDKYYRLVKLGCGTVAMSDADFQQTGLCQIDAYRDYIEQMYAARYVIKDINIGVSPWTMERMLNEDIPVVFSYFSLIDEKIIMYSSLQNAKECAEGTDDGNMNSHYMTITGLYKYSSGQPSHYKYVLEVVSWGKVYYIDYDSYAKKLDYLSNILSVY